MEYGIVLKSKNFFPKSTNSNLGYDKILVQKQGIVKKGKGV
mgnify:CR=1 FL=1